MAWDPATRRVVLFGGYALEVLGGNATRELADAWAWDGTAWHTITTTAAPTPRAMAAMDYDASRNRLVVFGGEESGAAKSDTWELVFIGTTSSTLTAISDLHQTGEVTMPLLQAFSVRVEDAHGLPVRGANVRFASVSGGGGLDVSQSTSDALGRAHAQGSCGMKSGLATWSASIDTGASVLFTATCLAGATASLSISTATAATVGVPIDLKVSALDRFGNVSGDLSDTLHFLSSDPLASLPVDRAIGPGGVLDLAHGITFETAGEQYVEVRDVERPVDIPPARMSGIVVTGGRASPTIQVSPETVDVKVGTDVAIDVTAMDPSGQTVTLKADALPSGASFPESSDMMPHQVLKWTPSSGQAGRYEIPFSATNEAGVTAKASAVVVVRGSYYGCSDVAPVRGGFGPLLAIAALLALAWVRPRRAIGSVLAFLLALAPGRALAEAQGIVASFEGVKATSSTSAPLADAIASYAATQLDELGVYRVQAASDAQVLRNADAERVKLGAEPTSRDEVGADRTIRGTLDNDQARREWVLAWVLLDKRGAQLGRVERRVAEGPSPAALLDAVRPMLLELIRSDPDREVSAHGSAPAAEAANGERSLYLSVVLRTDADVVGEGIGFGASVAAGTQTFGASAALILARPGKARPLGLRFEARLHPWTFGMVRPYLAFGTTAFIPEASLRAALGAEVDVHEGWLVTADLAAEHFPSPAQVRLADAVLLSIGVGKRFD
jgi:hypothetical protein